MKGLLEKLWLVWAGLCFAIIFLLLYPLLFVFLCSHKTYRIAHFIRKIWGGLSAVLCFVLPVVRYETTLPKNQQLIFCPNHMSYIDILTCGSFLPGFNFFMGKIELSKIPLFGIWFGTLDIAVDRENARESYRAFIQAAEQMDKIGANLIIYPEGRIPDDAPKLKFPFKVGAFRLAIEKQIPIVPVTLPDNLKRLDLDNFSGSPGIMRMFVHAPIETKGLSIEDIPMLQQKVYDVIYSQLKLLAVL
ncbi:MAG: 1-acyl-sn-glycerol-3-phosphate acyltransferase [Flavobacteriaceae bacterium]|nr:1-acyl-sn-glycerol-3-phosphate acyltransferase [Flavobacteriaceae bacterium]